MSPSQGRHAVVIGAGPAGLMAADMLAARGCSVTVFDRMPSPARKFLMAGRGGLNITHSEPFARFMTRYREAAPRLAAALEAFTPDDMRRWCEELGQPTFIGSSGRVFPKSMKASPLLRAWLRRLDNLGVRILPRHSFTGSSADGRLVFETPDGARAFAADITILALGGASWPRLGSDGGWATILGTQGLSLAPFRPANCGFETQWSAYMQARCSGQPLKNIAVQFGDVVQRGECILTPYGLEGGAIYALSAELRDAIEQTGSASLAMDLRPDTDLQALAARLASPRGKASLANHLRKCAGLDATEFMLLHETAAPFANAEALARHIKALPITLFRPRPLDRAISTAGGVPFEEMDDAFMLKNMPGVFCAGEMLDWEAPTGGYLLQACMATGRAAAQGALDWLSRRQDLTGPKPGIGETSGFG